MGPEIGSLWISEHLLTVFWPCPGDLERQQSTVIVHHWKGVEGGVLHRLKTWFVSFSIWKRLVVREANSEQSKLGASRDRFRGASSKMARYSFVNLVEAQIKNTCFYLFLAFACQGPAPKHFGLVRKSLWSPNYTQHARKPLCFNRSWIFGQDLQLIHTCISFVHENPFHPLARQFRGASHVRRKRGTVPLAGACSGMALEDRRYTHAKHFSILKHESRAKQISESWSGFGTNVATIRKDLQLTWIMRMISLPSSRVWTKSSSSCLACEVQIQISDDRSCM